MNRAPDPQSVHLSQVLVNNVLINKGCLFVTVEFKCRVAGI